MKRPDSRTDNLTNGLILGIAIVLGVLFVALIILGLGGDVLLSWIPVDRGTSVE